MEDQRIVDSVEARVRLEVLIREREGASGLQTDGDRHRPGPCAGCDRSRDATNGAKYCFHAAATVWVPWPRVTSLVGIRMKRPDLTRRSSRSTIASSGGLIRSSAELMARTGAAMRPRSGLGS